MSYISAVKLNNDVLVWERTNEGRELKIFPAPYYFYVKDPNGKHTSMYGDKLTRFDFDSYHEFNQARYKCQADNIELFESDIPPELKLLSSLYYNIPAPTLHVTFFDIEVDYNEKVGFASVDNPYAPINSVALYHSWSKKMVLFAVPPKEYFDSLDLNHVLPKLDSIAKLPNDTSLEIQFFTNEKELLIRLMSEIEDSDVLSGWNSDFFDIPYVGKRLEKIGKKYFNQLSFVNANNPKWRKVEVMKREMTTLDLSGRASADYMVIFKKYEMDERPSYKLEAIADELLPDLPKLEYQGSLAGLYRKDFLWFIRYNLRDTEILKGLEERLGYIELANQMYHLSTGLFDHVTGTLKLAELATINYCHHDLDGLIVNDLHPSDSDDHIQGAVVLVPQVGEHEWVGSIDINSLYTSVIRSINISPETLRGQFIEKTTAFEEIKNNTDTPLSLEISETNDIVTLPANQWKAKLKNLNLSISGYGTLFDQTKQGIIPAILSTWTNTRKKYQRLKKQAEESGDTIKATYYDKLQYVYKIKLNSFYGALNNRYFRFYDLRMGESTTGTGRLVLLHQCAKVCEILDGQYTPPEFKGKDDKGRDQFGYSNSHSAIYGDTDSTYFNTHANDIETAIKIADRVGELVNDSFPQFVSDNFLCKTGFDNIIKTGREIISDRGIFVDKKRYILHIADNEGNRTDKIKVMGLDTKKTTLPKHVSTNLNNFIGRYLKGEEWDVIAPEIVSYKEQLGSTEDIMSIGLPKGVKGVEDYTQRFKVDNNTFLPGHVAASIFYNMCLEQFNDKESTPIMSGMKIKVFYLTQTYGRFKSIAIPVDIEQIPSWFIQNFSVDRNAHITRLVDKPLGNIIKAIGKVPPSRQSLLVDSLLEF